MGGLMDEKTLVQLVIQVLAALQAQPRRKQVLVLFSGASAGQHEGLEAVSMLSQAGHSVTAVFTQAAALMIGEDKVKQKGASEVIPPGKWVDSPALVRAADLVLVPTLSMNQATAMASGAFDSLISTLALGALLAGKTVIAIRDGADPEGAGGKVWGAGTAAATLRARLSGNLKALESYGMVLVHGEEFLATVQQRLANAAPVQTSRAPLAPAVQVTATVITQADIAHLAEGSLLRVPKGSRLTPLAQESAGRLQLDVVYE